MTHPNKRALSTLPKELRRTTVPDAVRLWVRRELGSSVVRVRRLTGASSTSIHALSLDDGRRVVLRRYVWPGFLEDEPIAPVREADALRFAHAAGLPVPEALAADTTGDAVGDGIPVLLMTMARGEVVGVPDLHAFAEVAAQVHEVDASTFPHEYFKWYERVPDKYTPPGDVWRRAAEVWSGPVPGQPWRFLHRDLHPGNVLWSRGRPAVVDWANACRGPAGCDIATARANLIDWGSWDDADVFQHEYESITGTTHDPWFEIANVMENDLDQFADWQLATCEERLGRALASM